MRMIDDLKGRISSVTEITDLYSCEAYKSKDVTADFFIAVAESGVGSHWLGQYEITDDFTFEDAKKNFEKVAKQAGEKGYFYLSELESFDLF